MLKTEMRKHTENQKKLFFGPSTVEGKKPVINQSDRKMTFVFILCW